MPFGMEIKEHEATAQSQSQQQKLTESCPSKGWGRI